MCSVEKRLAGRIDEHVARSVISTIDNFIADRADDIKRIAELEDEVEKLKQPKPLGYMDGRFRNVITDLKKGNKGGTGIFITESTLQYIIYRDEDQTQRIEALRAEVERLKGELLKFEIVGVFDRVLQSETEDSDGLGHNGKE
jgi:uncharacterized small protein (DUF1192 family)